MKMTGAAKILKDHLTEENHPEEKGADIQAHLTDVRHYSQILWDSLFEFV